MRAERRQGPKGAAAKFIPAALLEGEPKSLTLQSLRRRERRPERVLGAPPLSHSVNSATFRVEDRLRRFRMAVLQWAIMTNARIGLLWFVAAVLFFLAAMVRAENNAVYIALGVVFLVLGSNSRRKNGEK